MRILKPLAFLFLAFLSTGKLYAQTVPVGFELDMSKPKEYIIGGDVKVEGTILDPQSLALIADLTPNKRIKVPGEDIPKAIKKLWETKYFSYVSIDADKVEGEYIFLTIHVKDRQRLGGFKSGGGMRKKEFESLTDEALDLYAGKLITEDLLYNVKRITKDFFVEKGYHSVKVEVTLDTCPQRIIKTKKGNTVAPPPVGPCLFIKVNKGPKIKIDDITFTGVKEFKHGALYRAMKETKRRKWWRVWKASKFQEGEYRADKEKILDKYYNKGFRDAYIVKDTFYDIDEKSMRIDITIDEGHKYYFRNITWIGNSKYRSGQLDTVLGIKKGDVFNQGELEARLFMNQSGGDVSSLYMDNGYLFFSVVPVETRIVGDSIDYEMRITEGRQARIRDIIIKGNTKTNDHIIRREIRTKPGDLFSRDAIIRTQRELAQMSYFDPEKMGVNPIPDPATGTVDIEYTVEEKPSDQIQLSGGWGGGRVIGTVGLTISNFSTRNFFKKGAWSPLPSGDGQQLSLNCQSTGAFYQGYNLSFVEPWLGGKKPNSLSINGYHTFTSNDSKKFKDPTKSKFKIFGASVGLGKRLKWPDDWFSIYNEVSYQYYDLQNFQGLFSFSNGYVNNLAYRFTLSRNSIDAPIFPRSGSNITFSAKATIPYSHFNDKDYSQLSDRQKFKFLEYAKFKFTTSHFISLTKKKMGPVLNARTGFGFLLPWNKKVGDSPFERFYMGGSGLTGVNFYFGREIIALRGYDDNSVSSQFGDPYIAKYTLELRQPISLNPQATVFLLGFLDGGKTWKELRKVNPFEVYRSAGVGVRLFLPMFGMLGFDYGWRLDTVDGLPNMQKSQFHFTIGMNLGEL
ncbi:MAG TPA: POTRA domain-containing protein [Flavobacteriales bacterium]|nr:POTRA domain-containing protein [Flavobacteriales bacterium]